MAVRMRLTRVGGRKDPVWRVVVADSRSPRDGRVIEIIGRYNAQTEPSTIVLKEDRVRHWLSKGAQPSSQVKQLLKTQGIKAQAGTPYTPGETPMASASATAVAEPPVAEPATAEPAEPATAEPAAAEEPAATPAAEEAPAGDTEATAPPADS